MAQDYLLLPDISIDGRRYQTNLESPQPDRWADCRYISECSISRILAAQLPTLSLDTAWVAWVDAPQGDLLRGNRVDSIDTEVRRQNKRHQAIALGPEVITQLDRACSGPLHQ